MDALLAAQVQSFGEPKRLNSAHCRVVADRAPVSNPFPLRIDRQNFLLNFLLANAPLLLPGTRLELSDASLCIIKPGLYLGNLLIEELLLRCEVVALRLFLFNSRRERVHLPEVAGASPPRRRLE